MWQYLSTPENSYVTWGLVGPRWGHRDYEAVVLAQRYTLTFAWLEDNQFKALASLTQGGTLESGWLNIWSRGNCKMHVWQELYEFLFKELGIKSLLAITSRKGLRHYAKRTNGEFVTIVKHWFGPNQDGYILQWQK